VTNEEFRTLRTEARGVLRRVQALPGFAAKREREVLRCPEIALTWPWHAVQLALTGRPPGLLRSRTTEDGNREIVRLDRRPLESTIAELGTYVDSIVRFSRAYLFGAEWSARALHDAQRSGGKAKLPRARPDQWIELRVKAVLLGDLERIVRELRDAQHSEGEVKRPHAKPDQWIELPVKPVRLGDLEGIVRELAPPKLKAEGSRKATWNGALNATRRRLAGATLTPTDRVNLHRARRYLDAAVNRTIQPRHADRDPHEPSDRGDYAKVVREEDKEIARLQAERRKRDAARKRRAAPGS
jgi:hypothetical protein